MSPPVSPAGVGSLSLPAATPTKPPARSRRTPILVVAALALVGGGVAAGVMAGSDEPSSSGSNSSSNSPIVRSTDPSATAAVDAPATPDTQLSVGAPVSTTPAPAPGAASAVVDAGDVLGIGTSMALPNCNGGYVTLVGAAVTPGQYPNQVRDILDRYPGTSYLLTRGQCTSLRQQMPDGSDIYVVYFGPYETAEEACFARVAGPVDAYVKRLDNTSDPNAAVDC